LKRTFLGAGAAGAAVPFFDLETGWAGSGMIAVESECGCRQEEPWREKMDQIKGTKTTKVIYKPNARRTIKSAEYNINLFRVLFPPAFMQKGPP